MKLWITDFLNSINHQKERADQKSNYTNCHRGKGKMIIESTFRKDSGTDWTQKYNDKTP